MHFCLAQKSISFSIRILVLVKGSGQCVYCLMFLFEHLCISLKVYVLNNQTKVTHKAAWVYISLHVCILIIILYWHLNLLWMEFQKTSKRTTKPTILSWTCHVYGPFEFRTFLGTSILPLTQTVHDRHLINRLIMFKNHLLCEIKV